jgi:hypothetical protein
MNSSTHDTVVALAHHRLVRMRGGEKVLEQFSALFPSAPYTLLGRREKLSATPRRNAIARSPLDRLPWADRHDKRTLPLFPSAAITDFEAEWQRFSPEAARSQAGKFSPERFRDQMKTCLTLRFPRLFADDASPGEPARKVQAMPEPHRFEGALRAA